MINLGIPLGFGVSLSWLAWDRGVDERARVASELGNPVVQSLTDSLDSKDKAGP